MKYKDKVKIINGSIVLFLIVVAFLLILSKLDEVEKITLASKAKIEFLEKTIEENKKTIVRR
jgi:hypothetical protein